MRISYVCTCAYTLLLQQAKGRWDTIMLAGVRDTKPATLYDRLLKKELPTTVVHEDDSVLAFRDINPAAPTHILIIPKVS
jgi:HIT domain